MRFTRRYSVAGRSVRDQVEWAKFDAAVSGTDFEMPGVEAPATWSQNAVNILASKYLRKAGVPNVTWQPEPAPGRPEEKMPLWLRLSIPGDAVTRTYSIGPETSAHQIFHRMAGCWTYWGWRGGYFDAEEDARVFYDECYMMLARQVAAPNSPQWFNCGLHWGYGIAGPDSGQWAIDWTTSKPFQPGSSYERPQPHACFLTPIADDLVNPGGIMDAWVTEARIFKGGSGSGTNVSRLRGPNELLSGGGKASGAMSFIEIGDRAAGAIQSGGTTRRAALMRIMDADHPEIMQFVGWKVREEAKAAAMHVGSVAINRRYDEVDDLVPPAVTDRLRAGIAMEEFGVGWEEEAIRTVSGQNSNNSIAVSDEFLRRLDAGESWQLRNRTDGTVAAEIAPDDLWTLTCRAAWACADPGVVYPDTVNVWHTCSADGDIRTCNPCAEYWFLENTACLLASLRLTAFLREDGTIDLGAYEHACRIWTVVLDISIQMAGFPTRGFAEGTRDYRTLGLGYADLGGLLMRLALPYDGDEGRALAAGLTALMTGVAYRTSSEMAEALGPFPRWKANAKSMWRVLRNHARAAKDLMGGASDYEGLNHRPYIAKAAQFGDGELNRRALSAWEQVLAAGSFRNAQTTLAAPTGTISLVMDCDTSGVEPDFALVKHKALAGGGAMRIVNRAVPEALRRLGYTDGQIIGVCAAIEESALDRCVFLKDEHRAVFDCAVPASEGGRSIAPMGHILMLAAVQPFLSGAASKTINLPHDATVADVDRVYRKSHRLGIKAVAIYRDGSKLTQPLTTKPADLRDQILAMQNELPKIGTFVDPVESAKDYLIVELRAEVDRLRAGNVVAMPARGRRRLPGLRRGYTRGAIVGGQKVYLRTGEYEDGTLGEVFVTLGKAGEALRAVMDCWAMAVSRGLQYGVPLEDHVRTFAATRFEPAGIVRDHERIKVCTSLMDFIVRDLAIHYLGRDDLANVPDAARVAEDPVRSIETHGDGGLTIAIRAGAMTASGTNSVAAARSSGYTGEVCGECRSFTVRRSGTCTTCDTCGANSGCG